MPTFNAPPGWPTPPPGWTPPDGWQPDRDWSPAPAGHVWWIEDQPTSPSLASPHHVAVGAPLGGAPHPAPPATSPAPVPPLLAPTQPPFDLVAHYAAEQRRAGLRAVVLGLVLAGVGVGVTVGGYASADVGGTHLVLWGPVVLGLISTVRGVVQLARAEQAAVRQVLAPVR